MALRKVEIIDNIAENESLSKKQVAAVLDSFIEQITNGLVAGEQVILQGFGTFTVKTRAARTGRNPKTGEEIQIEESQTPHFKPSKLFKENISCNLTTDVVE